jgi:HemY protein
VKFFIGLLLITGVAVALSLVAGAGTGYVLIVQPPYRIELSLNLLLILAIFGFIGLYALLHLIFYTMRLPETVHRFKAEQRRKEAFASLMESMHALAEGRYGKAEKSAAQALELGEVPELSALIAANSAHKLRNYPRRDFYLAEAERLAPEFALGRLLMQAELLLDEHRYSEALAALRQLDKVEAKHLPAIRLYFKIQPRLGNWERALNLIQLLEKRDAIEPLQAQQVRRRAHQFIIEQKAHDRDELLAYWKSIPETERLDSRLTALAARAFIATGNHAAGIQALEMSLTKQWDGELAKLYGECAGEDPTKQLQQAEYWLLQHHGDPNLLLSLGNLCLRQELWGKGESYLDASLSVEPSSTAHLALATIAEHKEDADSACKHYRQSLELALKGL